MSLPLASRPASPGFCVCLFACLLPGLLLPGVLLAQTGVAAPSTIGRLDVAGDWLRASGLDGFPSAFSDMLRMSLPDDCNASAVADAPALASALQQTLANAIPPELPAAVAPWLDSETAVRVREAESSLAGLDDAAYARLRDEHQAELTGGSTRLGQIRTLVDKTRAARLNTVMFNELELRERLFAQCRDPEALQALWSEIGEVSAGDDLVSFFLRFSLAESTLLMFRDLDPQDMDAYVAFVESPAGMRWHALLVDAVERALFEDRARSYHALRQ